MSPHRVFIESPFLLSVYKKINNYQNQLKIFYGINGFALSSSEEDSCKSSLYFFLAAFSSGTNASDR